MGSDCSTSNSLDFLLKQLEKCVAISEGFRGAPACKRPFFAIPRLHGILLRLQLTLLLRVFDVLAW